MTYHLLFILYLFWIMEVMLDKKEIPAILLEFKIGCNVVETPHNITNTSCSGTANEHTVHWWFKTFCKRDRSLEDEEWVVAHHQWKPLSKLILLQLQEKLPKNSGLTIYGPSALEANHKGETAQWVGASWADWKSKKSSLWSVIFSYSAQQ